MSSLSAALQTEGNVDFESGIIEGVRSPERSDLQVHLGQRSVPPNIYAATAREAGRINAAKISQQEYQNWLDERQALLDKKFAGTMTRVESNRLQYVLWSLDRIEDARHGAELEHLELLASSLESFQSSVEQLRSDLTKAKKSGRRR